MSVGSLTCSRQAANMPNVLGDSITFFCIVYYPFRGEGQMLGCAGEPPCGTENWVLFPCAVLRSLLQSIWALPGSQCLLEINNGSQRRKWALWLTGPPGSASRVLTQSSHLATGLCCSFTFLWCHVVSCLTFFTFLRVILASERGWKWKQK